MDAWASYYHHGQEGETPVVPHCRHCYGDCAGGCLLPGGTGLCIHKPVPTRTVSARLKLLRTRRFWRRVFWGVSAG
jgi:hypothetical protein